MSLPITRLDAKEIALGYLKTMEVRTDLELVLLNEETMERNFGWVFFYTSKRYLETQSIGDALAGNAPFVVMRGDGSIRLTGTAFPLEHYLREF
jgi:hypothetical protein